MQYCTRCVLPSISPTPTTFDQNGECSACRVARQGHQVDWARRRSMFEELIDQHRSPDGSNYDCIVPVSGGKDSYYQVHIVREYGLKPLLVTYHGNNYLPEAERNLNRMREVFDCDHMIFRPSVDVLIRINRLCFRMMGDMNWHAHCGIFTYPIQIALKHEIPLIVWGEHGFMDLAGMFSYSDFVEFTAKTRLEHSLRGFDWHDMIEETEGLTGSDLLWARYPSDDDLDRVGVRGVYISNFFPWDANQHAERMQRLYKWEPAEQPFDRTYRRISNLDDMHENGIHDYLKYVKFGYGRATDHSCKDIRAGRMTREEGIEMVRRYDHIVPTDLYRWLDYVGMSEEEFHATASRFRDPRVWTAAPDGSWTKQNLWTDGS